MIVTVDKIFNEVDRLFDEYLQIWEDVCNIESPTWFKEGIDNCCDYFANRAKIFGWEVEKFPQPIAGDPVCITMNPESKGRSISFSGHIDTVHPVGSFGTPPTRREGDKIYGPGVYDCKGGVVGAMLAMEALEKCGFKDRPIQLLLQTDEEGGTKYSNKANIKWICEKAKNSVAFINLESYRKGEICLERKGIATYIYKIHGVEAHSAYCAKAGANAIIEAAHKMLELEKIKDDDGITCSCNIIKGGTTHNTVAGYCEFTCNVRYVNSEQLAWIEAKAQQIADTVYVNGCTTELERTGFRDAMEFNEQNKKLIDDLNSAFAKYGMPTLTPIRRVGGSDAADASVFGIPTTDDLGTEGEQAHTPYEWSYLESLRECAKRLVVAAIEI